jgi:hypothetical protein
MDPMRMQRFGLNVLFTILAAGVLAANGQAEIISPLHPLVPSGLQPGDSFQIIFTTSTTRDATASTIAAYDSFVNGNADSFGFGPNSAAPISWTAIANVLDGTVTTTHSPQIDDVYDPTGSLFRSTAVGLYTTATVPGNATIERLDFASPTTEVWTGFDLTDVGSTTDALGGNTFAGYPLSGSNALWAFQSVRPASFTLPLYGLSESLTVASVPEPSTFVMLGTGAIVLIVFRRRNRKHVT